MNGGGFAISSPPAQATTYEPADRHFIRFPQHIDQQPLKLEQQCRTGELPSTFVRPWWGGVKRPSELGASVLLKELVLPRERVLSWAMVAGWCGHGR